MKVRAKIKYDTRHIIWILKVICPYCKKPHYHGGGAEEKPLLGSRVAHCLEGSTKQYEIIDEMGNSPKAETAITLPDPRQPGLSGEAL